jgi:RHS repeat-associated protein
MTRGDQRYFYLTDQQRSTMALTTLTGSVAETYTYDASGASTVHGNVSNPFTYTGQFFDQTAGLLLFPVRAEDPAMGRFLSEDPCLRINPYPYVANSPPNLIDPSGASDIAEEAILEEDSTCNALWGAAEVVLGNFPFYVELGIDTGLNVFAIEDEAAYDLIGPAANMIFIEQIIRAEKVVLISNFPPRVGSAFVDELEALREAGFTLRVCKSGIFAAPPGWKP